jgi:hypothetical protein
MRNSIGMMSGLGLLARAGLLAVLVTLGVGHSAPAKADTLLKSAATLVYGSAADTYSVVAPTSGTVTAYITTVPWPSPMSSLSFSATTATDTLSSWSATPDTMAGTHMETFQVGAGTFFAHIMATATGSFDLGLYGVMFTFSPSAVPLPATAGLLLIGFLVLFALRRTMQESGIRNESVMSVA